MMKIFVNWDEQIVATEQEMDQIEHDYFEATMKSLYDCPDYCFNDWLNRNYTASEVYDMSPNNQAIIKMEWLKWLHEQVRELTDEAMENDWERVDLGI